MRIVGFLTSAFLLGTAGAALAQELPDGYGTTMPNGSKVSTTLSSGLDVDDYVFDGYPGMKTTVTLKIPKKQGMLASLALLRPDGTMVTAEDAGAKFKTGKTITVTVQEQDPDTGDVIDVVKQIPQVLKITFPLDQLGVWKARVLLPDNMIPAGETGDYSIATKYNKPPKSTLKNPEETQPNIYQFRVNAEGGSKLTFNFSFKSGNATFNGLRAPNGEFVEVEKLKTKNNKFVKASNVAIPDDFPRGEYELAFTTAEGVTLTKTKFTSNVKLPKGDKKRKGKLDGNEPVIAGDPNPNVGGPPSLGNFGTQVTVNVINAFDEKNPNADPEMFLNDIPLDFVTTQPGSGATVVQGRVPSSVREGVFDLVVRTSTGQVSVRQGAFQVVPKPAVDDIDPLVGSAAGGFEVVITGEGFPEDISKVGILIDGNSVPVQKISVTQNEFRFIAPPRAPTFVTFGVEDLRSQLADNLPINSFEYLSTPGISRVIPGLVPILGGDALFVKGTNFRETDRLFMETAIQGEYVEIPNTFVNSNLHSFIAPVRPKGDYEIYVIDAQNVRTPGRRTVSYFQFADFTADTGLEGPPVNDLRDGWSTTLADFDNDGDDDLFLAKRGQGGRETTSQIQLFVNDGTGNLTDESATRIPAPSATDDWRADRIWVSDITQDGFADIVITTNSLQVPAANTSHTRILVSTKRNAGAENNDRVFVDRTLDLMAPPRIAGSGFGQGGGVSNTQGDNWRGLDMWIGDVDLGPAGPPEILITHKDLKEEIDVLCGNYCSSSIGGALYRFYWGGSRAFVWDSRARNGQGQYRYEHNFFPRRSGVLVPIGNPPPGVVIRGCNTGTPCRGMFTPFTGHSIAVQDIDADRKPDVVVLNDEVVNVDGSPTSSTQVGLNFFNANEGSLLTDVTADLKALGGVTTGAELAIGQFGFPDGNSFGTIVVTQAAAPSNGGRGIRMIKYLPSIIPDDPGDFEDITSKTIPSVSFEEAWQASAMAVLDVDADGDQDLVLVANAAPSPGIAALRILRNVIEDQQVGVLRDEFQGLIANVAGGGNDPLDGTSLAIGDLDGDDATEFVVTRSVPEGDDTQTRTMTTDR